MSWHRLFRRVRKKRPMAVREWRRPPVYCKPRFRPGWQPIPRTLVRNFPDA